jgi:excisionase family DNA binding protein
MIKGTGTVSPTIHAWQSLAADPLLDVRQIATMLNCDVSTVRRWISSGKLPAFRVAGGKYKLRTSVALAFMGEGSHE